MNKNSKGITLIALVITIIVLLILAGVTIAMVLGQDGIFKKAQTAGEKTTESQEIEVIKLAMNTIRTNDWENKIRKKELVTAEELKTEIERGGEYTVEVNGGSNLTVNYTNPGSSENTYLVTQEGQIIKNPPTIAEKFDRKGEEETAEGYDPTKLHIGDFVTYDAGTWTEEEIKAIQTGENANLQQANNSTNLPSGKFQFGGFTAGASRNGNATPYSTTYNYVKEQTEEGQQPVTGWRVFDVNEETGEVTLLSAGCPEDYCHPYVSGESNAYVSEYILTGKINSSWKKEDGTQMDEQTAQSMYTKRDWSKYVNQNQKATKARVLTKQELDTWYNRNKGFTNANVYTDATFQSVYDKKYETLIDDYVYQWLASPINGAGLCYVNPSGRNVNDYSSNACGLRVLVTLPSEIAIQEQPVGTKTIIDPRDSSNSWTYNVWELL